ncbi:glycoside hydrolase family 35 protein [Hysterangium stoloniferum]|nr:glycoside hydrolase family 35 protein [Hysterangium stoloniferum]
MSKARFSFTFSALLLLCLVLLTWPATLRVSTSSVPDFGSRTAFANPPRRSNGLTDVVQWDNYTLFVRGQRILLYSGEFHAFRIPVPDLWLDIFQKMKAAGLNGVSIYIHWGLSHPAPGVLDFDDWRDLQSLFDSASAAGLFIVLRPGPYINAETTAGGIAHWVTSQVAGELRTNATDYRAAWEPYIQAIIDATVPNQITNGGPIIAVQIDNEYSQKPINRAEYFAELEAAFRAGGVVVPLTHNEPGEGANFINGTGAVDIFGMDSYPQGQCSDPETWNPVTPNYHQYHESVTPSQPFYMPEFQGGSFDSWAGPGYDACWILTGPDYEDVFYKHNWASNAKLMSFYMLYGYDYGAAIRENRALSPKFDELKRQALFLRSSPEFKKTDWIGDTSTGGVSVNGTGAFVTLLRNPDSGTNFFIARQNDSTSTASVDFTITAQTSTGTLTLPRISNSIALDGRQSKVIVTDYSFGSSNLLYSTASIFFAGRIGSRDVLFLFGESTQSHEAALKLGPSNSGAWGISSFVKFSSDSANDVTTITFLPGITGLVTVWESSSQLVLFSDTVTATSFWAPVIPGSSDLSQYWEFGSNETVLVGGPYLVRNATIQNSELQLTGDLNASVTLTVFAPSNIMTVTWNGMPISDLKDIQGKSSAITGRLNMKATNSFRLPQLTNWKFADSLPEIQATFNDANWITANHTTTNIITPPVFGDGRVLYGCDYGFCEGAVIWRGHFNATGAETSVNLTISGGTAFAASVWINDVFIKSTPSDSSTPSQTNEIFTFPAGSVKTSQDNVVTVVQDNTGIDESGSTPDNSKSPRGIMGFKLNTGEFTTWKLQGKLGGYTGYPDRTRGILNEGGLFGEREGWHLPGFDTSKWQTRPLSEGLPNQDAGIGFFITTFDLHMPSGTDIPISFVFDDDSARYRALLFVNGWQYGKRVGYLGPQVKFPVHQGLLDYNGKNTVAIALWSLDANTIVSPKVTLVADGFIDGGVGHIALNNHKWSPRRSS